MEKLFYIKGNRVRGREVIKALLDKGYKNPFAWEGDDCQSYYFGDESGDIAKTCLYGSFGSFLKRYGEEIELSEPKVYGYDDVKKYYDVSVSPKVELSEAIDALIRLEQVRLHGTSVYGEIPAMCAPCYFIFVGDLTIYRSKNKALVVPRCLRFQTPEQAKIFIANNKSLIKALAGIC